MNDPDCSDYLELLRKVIAFRLQSRIMSARLMTSEKRVDHIINQRLWRVISS